MPPTSASRRFATRPVAAICGPPAAERCAALLLIARGDTDAAVVAAEHAADGFDAVGFPLDRARALFVAGEALRRSGKRTRAAERIRTAKEIFERLGAALWVERAETELRRAVLAPVVTAS